MLGLGAELPDWARHTVRNLGPAMSMLKERVGEEHNIRLCSDCGGTIVEIASTKRLGKALYALVGLILRPLPYV